MNKDSGHKTQEQELPVPVLFARSDSVYKTLGCDVYDIERDARTWPGGRSGIFHPPCRAWGRLSHIAKPRPEEKQLAVWSIAQIRKYGGVLEHPQSSKLWQELNLPTGENYDQYGGFTISVDQCWWGHRARKRTYLYIVGPRMWQLPATPLSFDIPPRVITQSKRKGDPGWRQRVPDAEREATPVEFAKFLIEVAQLCEDQFCRCKCENTNYRAADNRYRCFRCHKVLQISPASLGKQKRCQGKV